MLKKRMFIGYVEQESKQFNFVQVYENSSEVYTSLVAQGIIIGSLDFAEHEIAYCEGSVKMKEGE